ncbi:uncharacterized protein LOC103317404 isoform X1 [Nasonia vitripennis]|uniref:Uncharacterized protein n=1 Tax=Nasonia vitripennis TaxID=7425 RepID=A0A7M7HFM6_NASVI|nr:uncharacterized protein LOC103317404 isoform X1 [Nasonia vitripennis]
MPSKRGSKNQSAIRRSRHVESETNDGDEVSSQSSTGDNEGRSRESSRVERVISASSKKKRRKNDDNENYYSYERQKKEIRRKKDGESSYESYDYEEEDISVRKHNKKHRKPERVNNSSNGSIDNSSASINKKAQKSKRRSKQEKSDELPIAEILKKAQEQQRTKYEDPVPLPKLTTDTIYVQGRNGFNPVKIISNSKNNRQSSNMPHPSSRSRPIRIAVIFQQIWRAIGSICQGLLGGIALLHLILIKTYFNNTEEFINNYSTFSQIHTSIFSFLMAVAIIGTFDKFDLGHVSKNHWLAIFKKRFKSILAIPLYITAFVLHQMTAKVDDKLMLVHYNSSNITYHHPVDIFNETVDFMPEEIKMWNKLTLSKDIIAVLGWVFTSVDNQKDMFLRHLEEMNSYAENVNMPT